MIQEDKELLFTDLCARLHYVVFLKIGEYSDYTLQGIVPSNANKPLVVRCNGSDFECSIEIVKPYLRTMSSMTEEEAKEISILYGFKDILSAKITDGYIEIVVDDGFCNTETRTIWYDEIISSIEIFDWLNTHHFDYRGLIKKGLAVEAPEGMYNV